MRKLFTQLFSSKFQLLVPIFILFSLISNAATFRTLVGIQYRVPTNTQSRFWANSDTQLGENTGVEISYTPAGGGPTVYTKFLGTYDFGNFPGANWRVDVTFPAGATNAQYQLFTRNQTGSDYGFTGFVANNALLLPVTFIDFYFIVKDNQVQLKWATATEQDNDYFEIEKSTDATNWKTITKVNAVGNTSILQNYVATDISESKGIYYYRISQTDINGRKVYYGKVLKVVVNTELVVTIFPNPAADVIKILGLKETAIITVLDLKGATMLSQRATQSQNSIMLKGLSSGVYLVNIKTDTSNKSLKIFVR